MGQHCLSYWFIQSSIFWEPESPRAEAPVSLTCDPGLAFIVSLLPSGLMCEIKTKRKLSTRYSSGCSLAPGCLQGSTEDWDREMPITSRTKGSLVLSTPGSLVGLEPELGLPRLSRGRGSQFLQCSFCWSVLDVHLHSILGILSVLLGL